MTMGPEPIIIIFFISVLFAIVLYHFLSFYEAIELFFT